MHNVMYDAQVCVDVVPKSKIHQCTLETDLVDFNLKLFLNVDARSTANERGGLFQGHLTGLTAVCFECRSPSFVPKSLTPGS